MVYLIADNKSNLGCLKLMETSRLSDNLIKLIAEKMTDVKSIGFNANLADFKHLAGLTKLERVFWTGRQNPYESYGELEAFLAKLGPQLKELHFNDVQIPSNILLLIASKCPKLTRFSYRRSVATLNKHKLTDEAVLAIGTKLTKLRQLTLSPCQVTADGFNKLLTGSATKLRRLELVANEEQNGKYRFEQFNEQLVIFAKKHPKRTFDFKLISTSPFKGPQNAPPNLRVEFVFKPNK